MKKIFILAVVGPTASGKTALAIELAKKLNGEIISADSMQVYRDMQIATAAPTAWEQQQIPHHLVGFLDAGESFSAARYAELANQKVSQLVSRGKLPIFCGGTGFYLETVLENVEFLQQGNDPEIRNRLQQQKQELGIEAMFQRLQEIDPQTAQRLHIHDEKRILRALEVYETTNCTMTEQRLQSRKNASMYEVCYLGLTAREREVLYQRINLRVDAMIQAGLLSEAQQFFQRDDCMTAAQAIGYKELKPYFDGLCTFEEAVQHLKMQTRRYAKRQLSWFRRNPNIHWLYFDCMSKEELIRAALSVIREQKGGDSGETG